MPLTNSESGSLYPRTYKPGLFQYVLLLFMLGFFVQMVFTILYDKTGPDEQHRIIFIGLGIGLLALIVLVGLFTIGYKVILESDAIRIKSLMGEKRILRSDIASYYYSWGRGYSIIRFMAKAEHPLGQDGLLLDPPGSFSIRLTFDVDQAFYDWVIAIPLTPGMRPLPQPEADAAE